MLENRSDRQLVISTLAATGALLAIGLIAANLGFLDFGQGQNVRPVIEDIARVVTAVLAAIWIAVAAIVIWRMLNRKRGLAKNGPATSGGVLGLLVVLAVLGIIILFLRTNNLNFFPEQQGVPTDDSGGNGNPTDPGVGLAGGEFLFIIFIALMVIGVLALLRFGRRTPVRMSLAERRVREETLEVVQQAIEDLKESDDPREVIINTYRRMSQLMASRKLMEQEALTAGEFARLAVKRFGWAAAPIEELTHLFEEARYSLHSMGLPQKERAMACLEDIRRALVPPAEVRGGAGAAAAE